MKHLLFALCLCLSIATYGKGIKINQKSVFSTITVKLDKLEPQKDGAVNLTGELKQKRNFCYSVSLEGCNIITPDGKTTSGTLTKWNDISAGSRSERTVSDGESEKFIITFPNLDVDQCQKFVLNLGTVLNREKTPIIIQVDIPEK